MSELDRLKEKYRNEISIISNGNMTYTYLGAKNLVCRIIEEAYHARDEEIRKLEKKLEMSKRREVNLCGDHHGKSYNEGCILCTYEKRHKQKATLEPLYEEKVNDFMLKLRFQKEGVGFVNPRFSSEAGKEGFFSGDTARKIAQKICSTFGTPCHEDLVERIEKTLIKHTFLLDCPQKSCKVLAQAIAKEIEK